MPEVKWIKITTDIFDDEKILLIESLPDSYAIITVWFKLLCFAGKQNNSGVFMMNNRIAYTDKMLSTIFRMKESIVQMSLKVFDEFGMIEMVDGVITIPNWGKHQSLDKMEDRKEYMKTYMRDYRTKQKDIALSGNTEAGYGLNGWKGILDYFDNSCAYCGKTDCDLEQEHVIPINDGGKFEMGNIIPACRSCNASKQNKSVFDWYVNQPFYNSNRMEKIVNLTRVNNVNRVNSLEVEVDKEVDKDIDKEIKPNGTRHKFGEYGKVLLTDEQHTKLITDFGQQVVDSVIKKMDEWITMKGKGYKDYNLALRKWIKDEKTTPQAKKSEFNNYDQRNYDYGDLEKKLLGGGE